MRLAPISGYTVRLKRTDRQPGFTEITYTVSKFYCGRKMMQYVLQRDWRGQDSVVGCHDLPVLHFHRFGRHTGRTPHWVLQHSPGLHESRLDPPHMYNCDGVCVYVSCVCVHVHVCVCACVWWYECGKYGKAICCQTELSPHVTLHYGLIIPSLKTALWTNNTLTKDHCALD